MGAEARSIVHRLDHVVVALDDAAAAHSFCADVLGLPVAWPFENFGSFASGGIGLGNLNLELCFPGEGLRATTPARVGALAFEPAEFVDDPLLAALDERGISHSDPAPTPGWTNVLLHSFFGDVRTFFCDYHIPGARDSTLRAKALEAVDGGKLEVLRASRVTIGARDFAAATSRWGRLFDPIRVTSEGDWCFPDGADIRLVDSPENEVVDIVLQVRREAAIAVLAAYRGSADPLCGLPISFEIAQ